MFNLENVISAVDNLPTLPTIFATISEAMEDPRMTTEKLAKIIASDQASAFKVLKVANSPLYGFRGKIDTISQAIFYIGFTEVRNIVFALTVINFFSKDKSLEKFHPVDFWAHSIGTGIATRTIGQEAGEKKLENYFLAGVLHDVGKIIFLQYAKEEYGAVLDLIETKKCSVREAEIELIGFDHTRVGQLLAEKWKIPSSIQDSVRYHHNGIINNENAKLVASVHVGNIVARILGFGFAGDNFIPHPNPGVWEILKINKGFFVSSRKKMEEDYDHLIKLMLVE